VVDLRLLAHGERVFEPEPVTRDRIWLDYLASPARPAIEDALSWLIVGEDAPAESPREGRLRLLDAQLKILDGRLPVPAESDRNEAARSVATLAGFVAPDNRSDGPGEAEAVRARIASAGSVLLDSVEAVDDEALASAANDTRRALSRSVDAGLEQMLHSTDESFRRLEFDLEAALSETLTRQTSTAVSPSPPRR
jgi:hypothetical protein